MKTATFESGAVMRAAGVPRLPDRVSEGMVVLDAVHHSGQQANDLACR
jgi:hypothetical protein